MQESTWYGFRRIDFEFEGMGAILVFPKEENEHKNWLLKTEYFGAFQNFELEMVKRGWHLAFLSNITRWCKDEDLARKARFAEFLAQNYGLYPKCVPVGMSCGGLIAVKFAARYPQYVSALYLDAPVMNFLSCPAGLSGKCKDDMLPEFISAMGMDLSALICYRQHPIDQMHFLLENHIPIVLVYGEADSVVPYVENGALLEDYYRKNGGTLLAIGKPGCDHHPHGLEDPAPLVAFAEAHCL